MKSFYSVLFVALVAAPGAFAACFTFTGTGPRFVGPVKLFTEATKVCTNKVNAFGGRKYFSVRFADAEGDLGQFASQTEMLGRCPGFCRSYTLTSGNANGKNVNPDSTDVQFQVETENGTLTISHPTSGKKVYPVSRD